MEVKRGTRVSLNTRNRNYYFQGVNGINLRIGKEETAIIPEDITEPYLDMIRTSVARGQLIVGWAEKPKPEVKYSSDDDTILEKGVKKLVPFLEEIAKTKGKGEDSPVYRLEKLLKAEKEDKNRKTVISKLDELLDKLSGVSSVVEEDEEEITINLV